MCGYGVKALRYGQELQFKWLNGSVRVKLHSYILYSYNNQFHFTVAKKTLCQLRQLYFKLKDEVFSNDRIGFAYNTEALEKLLKEELGMDMTMNDVKFPRYIESIPTYSLTLSISQSPPCSSLHHATLKSYHISLSDLAY